MAAIFVATYAVEALVLSQDALQQLTLWLAFIPYRLFDPAYLPGGIWPVFWTSITYAFLHAGWDHVLLNTVWFVIFATPMARRYGAGVLLAIFVLSSVAGAVAFAFTTWGQLQFLVGASGGVAGLTGAATRFIFQPVLFANDPETGGRVVLGRRTASLREMFANPRSRNFSLIWLILNAAVPFLPIFLNGEGVQVAWQAHLGGFIAGALLLPFFERRPHE